MAKSEQTHANANLSPAQETLSQLWEDHVRYEFSTRNIEDTLATMVEDAYVNHIPVLTGGGGRDGVQVHPHHSHGLVVARYRSDGKARGGSASCDRSI